jgi:hypothetical protein
MPGLPRRRPGGFKFRNSKGFHFQANSRLFSAIRAENGISRAN